MPNRACHGLLGIVVAAGLILAGSTSRAQLSGLRPSYNPDDPYQVPDAPAPPTLPDLTHRALLLSLEVTGASVQPARGEDGTKESRVGVGMGRLEAEAAISNRRWYLGLAQEVAGGRGDSSAFLVGNPELWGRGLWASKAGLAYGGGLGIVPPLIPQDPDEGPSVRNTIRVVRPWDYPHFAGRVIAFRPFIDVRDIDGPVILQLRQGIDVLTGTSEQALFQEFTLTSRTTFYIGFRPMEEMGLGLELWEVYFIKAPGIEDDERAVFAVSPNVRWMSQVLQPAVSMIFPIDRTLFRSAQSYWAIRLTLGMILDPSPP